MYGTDELELQRLEDEYFGSNSAQGMVYRDLADNSESARLDVKAAIGHLKILIADKAEKNAELECAYDDRAEEAWLETQKEICPIVQRFMLLDLD